MHWTYALLHTVESGQPAYSVHCLRQPFLHCGAGPNCTNLVPPLPSPFSTGLPLPCPCSPLHNPTIPLPLPSLPVPLLPVPGVTEVKRTHGPGSTDDAVKSIVHDVRKLVCHNCLEFSTDLYGLLIIQVVGT